jgi:hypothetical protein
VSGEKEIMALTQAMIGKVLTSVGFFNESILLGLDAIELTAGLWPDVIRDGNIISYGMAEYRNELCAAIGSCVTDVRLDADTMSISLESSEILLPLRSLKESGNRPTLMIRTSDRSVTL